MDQLHKRFADDQLRVIFQGYCQGLLSSAQIQQMLGMAKTRFFALLKDYRRDPQSFSIAYHRTTSTRLPALLEAEIEQALLQDKQLVDDPDLPISDYNYSALRDRLANKGTIVSQHDHQSCQAPRLLQAARKEKGA